MGLSLLLAGAAAGWFGRRAILSCARGVARSWNSPDGAQAEFERELGHRGRILAVGSGESSVNAEGTEIVDAEQVATVRTALRGADPAALAAALDEDGARGLLVAADPTGVVPSSLEDRLKRYDTPPGLRCVYLDTRHALYLRQEPLAIDARYASALAHVARALLAGARPPRTGSFPAQLRSTRNVEIMVLLRDAGRPRLWRSARSDSVADALVTAAVVARQRWSEHAVAMQAAIDAELPSLDVEVYWLADEGTLGAFEPSFLRRAIRTDFGVGYEHGASWRYLLPEATEEAGKGNPADAFAALFQEGSLPASSLGRADLRHYRLRSELIGRSVAESPAAATSAGAPTGSSTVNSVPP